MIPNLFDPWLISESGMRLCLAVASRGQHFDEDRIKALEARAGAPLNNARSVTVRGGIATIPINGPLFRHASMMTDLSGATSYAAIRKDLQAAIDSPAIKGVVLSIDSPGGEVTGVAELAAAITEANKVKPVVAYVGGTAASAAYWLASAADSIVAAPTSALGSIGAVLAVTDNRKAQEAAGEQTIEFVSSMSPNKRPDPQTDAGRAEYQRRVDEIGAVFVDAVASNRGVTVDDVISKFGGGGVLTGANAVAAGLADRLGDYESTLAALGARVGFGHTGELAMTIEEAAADAAKVEALSRFQTQALALVGATNPDEALGAIGALVERAAAGDKALADVAALKADANKRDLRAMLDAAIDAKRLDLGSVRAGVVAMIEAVAPEQATAIRAALSAIPEKSAADFNERAAVLDAVCSVDIGAGGVRAVSAYVANKGPIAAAPAVEPARTDHADAKELTKDAAQISATAEATRAHFHKKPTTTSGSAAK